MQISDTPDGMAQMAIEQVEDPVYVCAVALGTDEQVIARAFLDLETFDSVILSMQQARAIHVGEVSSGTLTTSSGIAVKQ